MNSFFFYRRLRGPVFLLTFGVTALLAQWHILGFDRSWPIYLIVAGLLRLAEGMAFRAVQPLQQAAPAPYGAVAGWAASPTPATPGTPGTSLATMSPATPPVPFTPVREEER